MLKSITFIYLLTTVAASQEVVETENWHLFTQAENGTVSLLHGLSRRTCEFAMNRALRRPATEAEKEAEATARRRQGTYSYTYTTSPGDIRRAECFQ